jgi:hypothetical protein
MLKTWLLAGHSEFSLRELALAPAAGGGGQTAARELRHRLISALSHIRSAGAAIPVTVQVDRLLEKTVLYFLSEFPEHFSSGAPSATNVGGGSGGGGATRAPLFGKALDSNVQQAQQPDFRQQPPVLYQPEMSLLPPAPSQPLFPIIPPASGPPPPGHQAGAGLPQRQPPQFSMFPLPVASAPVPPPPPSIGLAYQYQQMAAADKGSFFRPPPGMGGGERSSRLTTLPPPVSASFAGPPPPPPPSSTLPHPSGGDRRLGVPYPMPPSVGGPIFGKPLESAPIFGKPLDSAANIRPPSPPQWRRPSGVSMSLSKPAAANNLPLPLSADSEFEAQCASLQPFYEYLSIKMTDVMKVLNYSVAHIDVSCQLWYIL